MVCVDILNNTYKVHKMISIAKNSIGNHNIIEKIKDRISNSIFDIIYSTNTCIRVKTKDSLDINSLDPNSIYGIIYNVFDELLSEYNNIISSNISNSMNIEYDDVMYYIKNNNTIKKMYFIIPIMPYGLYEIKF